MLTEIFAALLPRPKRGKCRGQKLDALPISGRGQQRVAVVIATRGRPEIVARVVAQLGLKTRPADHVVVVGAQIIDVAKVRSVAGKYGPEKWPPEWCYVGLFTNFQLALPCAKSHGSTSIFGS